MVSGRIWKFPESSRGIFDRGDPNHVITEEDLRKIKVGITGEPDETTKEAVRDAEDRIADHKADNEDDTTPGAQKATPWDVLETE